VQLAAALLHNPDLPILGKDRSFATKRHGVAPV
jgi:hypothetical protein